MLIRNAEIYAHGIGDLRIRRGHIEQIGSLTPADGERVIDAAGGALLPGLHDHHIHLMSYAASLSSVLCGPPAVADEPSLLRALSDAASGSGEGWLRGVGYHESVAGDIDRAWLDSLVPHRPLRIQHRSGRLWVVNSPGLDQISAAVGKLPEHERPGLASNGRLFDIDTALHQLPDATAPPVDQASRRLASYGVTGITDMTPSNDSSAFEYFARLQGSGSLLQRVCMAGSLELKAPDRQSAHLTVGATKVHLHQAHLPDLDALITDIGSSHRRGRPLAVHCVTELELVFALAALNGARDLEATAPATADRIEHASVTPPALLSQIQELGLTVVTQPNFVAERGDTYLDDLPAPEHPWLYRCASLLDARIPLAGGTDAPFGGADPWHAMDAATSRRAPSGRVLGGDERLTPEQALALFLGSADSPATPRPIAARAVADLCLLRRPWQQVRGELSSRWVRAVIRDGELIYDAIDEAPFEGDVSRDGVS